MIATVANWDEDGDPVLFKDEHGIVWIAICEGPERSIAVEACEEDIAGVFRWTDREEDRGTIERVVDGASYQTTNAYKLVASNGAWTDEDDD